MLNSKQLPSKGAKQDSLVERGEGTGGGGGGGAWGLGLGACRPILSTDSPVPTEEGPTVRVQPTPRIIEEKPRTPRGRRGAGKKYLLAFEVNSFLQL